QRECQASEFNCTNGRCIHGSYRCDFDDDCEVRMSNCLPRILLPTRISSVARTPASSSRSRGDVTEFPTVPTVTTRFSTAIGMTTVTGSEWSTAAAEDA
ncbi:hypothetical protein GBAR_LOCUS30360, partial [Geodia barretti]